MYILGMITLTFFAVIGLACFIGAIVRGRSENDEGTLIVLKELSEANAEARVRHGIRICEEFRCERLICECTDDGSIRICEMLKEDNPVIEIKC